VPKVKRDWSYAFIRRKRLWDIVTVHQPFDKTKEGEMGHVTHPKEIRNAHNIVTVRSKKSEGVT
jgi:hypothetical protein